MKFLILISLCVLTALPALAQKPEPIYSFARVSKPLPWYREQAKAWKKVVDEDPKNANAWYNYYRVNRNLNFCDTTDTRPYMAKKEAMNKLIADMGNNIPNTYEYNLVKWMTQGNNFDSLIYLKNAAALGAGHWEYYDSMLTWGEVERNQEMKDTYSKKWFESGETSPGFLYYNYNVLSGLKPNAIIFTSGDNDTYPLWILQAQGIRRDVTVLNMSLLFIDSYREKIFRELGVEKYDVIENYKKQNPDRSKEGSDIGNESYKHYQKVIIQHVTANKKAYPVYIGLTVGKEYTAALEENLYLTGLVYQYSAQTIDNIAIMKRNFEQYYTLDYIDKLFYSDISDDMVKRMNCNYVVPMLKLFDHYKISGDNRKMDWIKEKVLYISKGGPEEKDTRNYLEQE